MAAACARNRHLVCLDERLLMRVLVVTCVHRADDARVYQRQIRQLVESGHEVVYIAPPFNDPDAVAFEGVEHIEVPRAVGRRRVQSWRRVRAEVGRCRDGCDVMVVHDLELTFVLRGTGRTPMVFDVKEDTPAAIADKAWLPSWAQAVASRVAARLERQAARGHHLILAEYSYRDRLGDHPVVPNSTWIPDDEPLPPGHDVVYVGRISQGRGAETLLAVGRALEPGRLLLIGDADDDVRPAVEREVRSGAVRWTGFLPNPEALRLVEGALAGLSLLRPEPNYVHSQPTKMVEYFARGVPVITTPLPLARELVERTCAGLVVPYDDPAAVVAAIYRLDNDLALRTEMGANGYEAARAQFDWSRDGRAFVSLLEDVAASG